MTEQPRIAPASRLWRAGLCAAFCLSLLCCGGGGGGGGGGRGGSSGSSAAPGTPPPSGANVADVVVDAGPTSASPDVNTLFTTVTVCVPGSTTSCQTIDHVQVDTASYGLRLLAPALTLSLPVKSAANGGSLVECTQFVDGYSWGPVTLVDVQISGEAASSVPVQIIGDSRFPTVPADCSSIGPAEDTVAAFGANGILGIGVFPQDCGSGCATTAANGNYYACSSVQCQPTTAALSSQVVNPVTLFVTDNNGVIIGLPSVPPQGAATVSGTLIFGIDTQSNNKSGSQFVLTLDPNTGAMTTVFDGKSLAQSFFDTGSNGLYFNDTNPASSLVKCRDSSVANFYCPASTQSLSATVQGQNGASATLDFSVANAQTLLVNEPSFGAFADLSGPYPGTTPSFDWGLPFYFGRTVYTAIENATTSVGTGPYVAF